MGPSHVAAFAVVPVVAEHAVVAAATVEAGIAAKHLPLFVVVEVAAVASVAAVVAATAIDVAAGVVVAVEYSAYQELQAWEHLVFHKH